jgi:hypothetical protein
MDDIVMKALRDGWRLGPGTFVRQSPVYHRAPAKRLSDVMIWLRSVGANRRSV